MDKIKQAYLYCDPRSLNDATNYYNGIVIKSLSECGYTTNTVHNLSDIKNADLIYTITERYFFQAKCRHPFVKTIYWAQGIGAEEAKWDAGANNSKCRYYFRRLTEYIAVNYSNVLICVSQRMIEYFADTYHLNNHGQIVVMPCYNLQLSNEFDCKQYYVPVFAYAGNCCVWQGVDFMLDVYSKIERELPNAQIRLFTGNKKEFEEKLVARGIKNYCIEYLPVNQLQDELHKCKYGFIIRDNHIVNQVATPTKMNSYLAAYMIPIFSNGVDDFKRNVVLDDFTLMAECPLDSDKVARMVIDFERSNQNYLDYQKIVEGVFERHYSDAKYVDLISQLINNFAG